MFKLKMVEKPELLNLKTNVEFPPVYVQTDHSKLENLDYKNSGHIGFASSDDLEKKVDKRIVAKNVPHCTDCAILADKKNEALFRTMCKKMMK